MPKWNEPGRNPYGPVGSIKASRSGHELLPAFGIILVDSRRKPYSGKGVNLPNGHLLIRVTGFSHQRAICENEGDSPAGDPTAKRLAAIRQRSSRGSSLGESRFLRGVVTGLNREPKAWHNAARGQGWSMGALRSCR